MFPELTIEKKHLSKINRVLLVNYDSDSFKFRHYSINFKTTGVNRQIQNILSGKIKNYSNLSDISQFIDMNSDSECEDSTRQVKLVELGPRLDLSLIKIQDGFCNGKVIYHKFKVKTKEEELEMEEKILKREMERKERRENQERNVERKKGGLKMDEFDDEEEEEEVEEVDDINLDDDAGVQDE